MHTFKLTVAVFFLLLMVSCGKSDTTPGNGGTSNNPVPVLNSITPGTAVAGGASFTLTVNGSGFINGSTINWNGAAYAATFVNSTQLTATFPAASIVLAGTVPITVYTPTPGGGTSNAINFIITGGNNPLPVATGLTPNNVTVGGGSFTLAVTGSNFISSSIIKWNNVALTTTFVNSSQITALIPAANIATAGTASVTVFTAAPGGGTSTALTFTINATAPVIKRFLFDATHGEIAGNADWVIDEDAVPQSIPTPAQSTVTAATPESYWTGALSSWVLNWQNLVIR